MAVAQPCLEVSVIEKHISCLVSVISLDLTYFSTKFIEKELVTDTAANSVLTSHGIGDDEKARQLLNKVTSILKSIESMRQKRFLEFVTIFSAKPPYRGLADKIIKGYNVA